MSLETSLFASHARGSTFTFRCAIDCHVGAYSLREGDLLKIMDDRDGLYSVYVEWGEGAVGRLNAHDISKLAGSKLIGEAAL